MKTTFRYSSVGLHSRHDGERCNHVIFRYIRNGARLKRALVLLLVIFAACSPDESQFRYTVNGRVTEQGGANINGNNLSITLSPATSNDKIVNSDGSYAFHKVIEGEYTVSVTDNSGMFYEETSDPFHVGKGSNNNVQITLRRRAFSITGKVTDASTNSAISGVSVKYSGAIVATTDASGNYTTPQYQPGSYSFTFEKDGYQAKTASTTISNTGASPLDVKLTP
ncbi:MAG: carboxypeptidase-like regulatory domain-containing protein, partial [Tannerella sp.]|nr:carboxypeptidase-like regulatory domain-containing protein [Tannerella sp.]